MFSIQLARQGQTMEQGTIVQWKKQEGDDIAVGEELYEIETEKAIVPIEVTRPGRLLKLLVAPGDTVVVGTLLALAADPGERVSASQLEDAVRTGVVSEKSQSVHEPVAGVRPAAASDNQKKPTAVPKARVLAQELGVDLAHVQGSGEGGMILPEDVRRAKPSQPEKSLCRRVPLSPIARSTIAALERAWQTPQFTQGILIDASALVRAKSDSGRNLSYMDLFLDAIVRAARTVPDVLARVVENDIVYQQSIDISIATATDAGLLIPVLRDAGGFSMDSRSAAWRQVVDGARAGRLTPQQMSGGIIALSNLGTRGVDYGTPLLPVGHAAIIFVGALATRPLAVAEKLEARPSLHVAITYDHRVIDGVLASRFTSAINEALLDPHT
jgi:pyruvate dehydrogenase E2 component (dihydrolipoamide acetyltransferase)